MTLISVPTEDSIIFEHYFETVWNMEMCYNFQEHYKIQKIIEDIMYACGYQKGVSFFMLARAHDIIYDRE